MKITFNPFKRAPLLNDVIFFSYFYVKDKYNL